MSAGNLLGALINSFLFPVIWIIGGVVINSFANMANLSALSMPVFQGSFDAFNTLQIGYGLLLVAAWLLIWLNYAINQNNEGNQVV